MLSRKYSDNKYDKPEVDARIESQTLKALESLGITGVMAEGEAALARSKASGTDQINLKVGAQFGNKAK